MWSIISGRSQNPAGADANDPSRELTFSFQKKIRRVAVIGGGPMAVSWAAYYFMHGFDVVAADPAQKGNLRQYVDSLLRAVLERNQPGATRGTIRIASDLDEALLRADFIQECALAKPNSKVDLLAEIDKCTRPDSIIASDADSSIMNVAQGILHFGDRCVIARSLDLPHLNPFTLIISCAGTSPSAIKQAMELYTRVARLPIYLRGEVSEEFTDALLAMFRREAVQLRELDIMSELDLHNSRIWAPSLCCSALVSAMQKAADGVERGLIRFPHHPDNTRIARQSRSLSILRSGISANPACVA
jgi:hypothetical protein